MRSSRACAALVLPLVALVACSSTDGAVSGDCPSPASLVVGVEAEQGIAQRVRSYRVTAEIDGAVVARDLLSVTGARPMFPSELPVSASRAAQVKITVAGFDAPTTSKEPTPGEPAPVLVRTATTQLVCGERLLARMRLQNGCVSGGAGATGPSCNEPQTCIGGSCVDATIVRENLETYAADWAQRSDVCSSGGEPELVLGTGQASFAPVTEAPLQAEPGPQGGHHIWMAVRMKNLKQYESTVIVSAEQPGGVSVPATAAAFPFAPDADGYCKLVGLRFQLDGADRPIAGFLGKPLDVTATARDSAGKTVTAKDRVNVAATLASP